MTQRKEDGQHTGMSHQDVVAIIELKEDASVLWKRKVLRDKGFEVFECVLFIL